MTCTAIHPAFFKLCPQGKIPGITPLAIPHVIVSQRHHFHLQPPWRFLSSLSGSKTSERHDMNRFFISYFCYVRGTGKKRVGKNQLAVFILVSRMGNLCRNGRIPGSNAAGVHKKEGDICPPITRRSPIILSRAKREPAPVRGSACHRLAMLSSLHRLKLYDPACGCWCNRPES